MRMRQIPLEDLDRLRAAAAEAVRATTLDALAAELGRIEYRGSRSLGGDTLSPAELKCFLFQDAALSPGETVGERA